MVRINHAASYFMPMFCSSKPYVVILATLVTSLLFLVMYVTSHALSKQYDDPGLFKPNSQDYFRTSLLGIFSPILFYFIKTFLFNINKRYLILNLLVDFPLNDWFILFIIICLAYPQLEQPQDMQESYMWHILPRQSYLFGIAWSLGEFIICVIGNIFQYQEIPAGNKTTTNGSSYMNGENLFYEGSEDLENADSTIQRDQITLSKCIGVRRNSSTISNNVYCPENDLKGFHHSANDYGSIRQGESNGNIEDTIVMVDPNDNSLRLTSLEAEESNSKGLKHLGLNTGRSQMLCEASDGNHGARILVKNFLPVQSNKDLFRGIGLLLLVLTSNIALTIGESLIMSIYFVYVPGHDALFTRMVNHFGKKTIQHFLMVIIVPFTLLNLLANGIIYLCKDLNEWFNDSSSPGGFSKPYSNSVRNYQDFYESESSLHRSRPGSIAIQELSTSQDPSSLMLISSPVDYPHHYGAHAQDYDASAPRILTFAKNVIGSWKRIALKDEFILTSMFSWGLIVFITGMKCTVIF